MARSRAALTARWSPSAERDLGRIFDYLLERSPRAAEAAVVRIIGTVDLLETQPEMGAAAEDLEPAGWFRHFAIPPYRVIYRVLPSELWVVRIWDTRRNPADLRVLVDDGGPTSRGVPDEKPGGGGAG